MSNILKFLVIKLIEEIDGGYDLEKALEICNEIQDEIVFKLVMRDLLVPEI